MKRKPLAILLSPLVLVAATQASNVYFGTGGDGIYSGRFDAETGTLSDIARAYEINNAGFIAIHPTLPVLYAASVPKKAMSGNGSVSALKMEADGSLSLLNQQSSEGKGACHVGTDPSGSVVMAANYFSGSVISFQALTDGSISQQRSLHQHEGSGENPKRQEGPHAHSVFTNPDGSYAYVPDLGIDRIMIYKVDPSTGTLAESGFAEVPGGAMGPRHMKWSADGQYAYVLNELDLSLTVFRPGKEPGALEWIDTKSILPEDADREQLSSAEVRIHPNGKFIYASIRDLAGKERDAISVFSACDSGIERIATVPVQVRIPRNFNLDPTGKWLLVGGQRSNNLAIFSVDPSSGLLEYSETVEFKHGPICIEFAR